MKTKIILMGLLTLGFSASAQTAAPAAAQSPVAGTVNQVAVENTVIVNVPPVTAPLNRILGTAPIAIPAGFTDKQALDSIEAAVHTANPKNKQGGFSLLGQWTLEERDPANKWIRVAIRIRAHYAAVCYRIENGNLVPDVPVSRNLNQNGSKIHDNVPRWINNFGRIIKLEMQKMQAAPATAPAAVQPPAAPTAAQPPAAPARFCEGCGRKASGPDVKFCGGCGRKF